MERAGAIVGDTLTLLRASVVPGITTGELNRIADDNIRRHGAVPTFLGYQGFSGGDLRVGERGNRTRHPRQAGAEGRGHH